MSGPQATYEWKRLPWRKLEVAVFKLQKRIYKASQAGDIRRVHRLQRLLLKSQAAKLLAVRRVTQDNQGKNTAGIDGIKSLTPPQLGDAPGDVPRDATQLGKATQASTRALPSLRTRFHAGDPCGTAPSRW